MAEKAAETATVKRKQEEIKSEESDNEDTEFNAANSINRKNTFSPS